MKGDDMISPAFDMCLVQEVEILRCMFPRG